MDCRTFHARHVGFVDDVLPGIEIVEMQRHIAECAPCARHDALIRRSLLVFRNMPTIQCSADFTDRVNDRIRALSLAPKARPVSFLTPGGTFARSSLPGWLSLPARTCCPSPMLPCRMRPSSR